MSDKKVFLLLIICTATYSFLLYWFAHTAGYESGVNACIAEEESYFPVKRENNLVARNNL